MTEPDEKPSRTTPAIERAWVRWVEQRDEAARDQLIVHYSPLVKFVAGRVAAGLPAGVDTGELVGTGVFGLMDAVDRFDPSLGWKFETFAVPRIKGAILDGLRAQDWVPRSIRNKGRQIEQAVAKLGNELKRAPTDEEIAVELGISDEELAKWLSSLSVANVGPLDHVVSGGEAEPRQLPASRDDGPDAVVEDRELRQIMRAEIRNLPERERTVVALYYDEGMTLAEIGDVLGVTESRVSQIHSKAVIMLRARLAAAGI
ncbi:MAG: FliA/WhiG family RNA polymerase sigma factor [Ilumatobacteraceae bacterium]|nr:FliA/WhiG family RNA polymerase sigma factor [Ilumatobacteraceae bacterium]